MGICLAYIGAALSRRPLSTVLTVFSVVLAFFLFAFLESLRFGLSRGVELAGSDRLLTVNRVSVSQPLPVAYRNRIASLTGVEAVTHVSWIAAFFQTERQQIRATPIHADSYFSVYHELKVDPDTMTIWRGTRDGALVGTQLAAQFGWQVGDRVPIRSGIYRTDEGSDTWTVTILGVFAAPEGSDDSLNMLIHYDYFNRVRTRDRDSVGWFVLNVIDGESPREVAEQIDKLFTNSGSETKTSTEQDMALRLVNQIGNVGSLLLSVAGVVLAVLVVFVLSVIMQSIVDRRNDTVTLRYLGFKRVHLALLEQVYCVLLVVPAALTGLCLAWFAGELLAPVIRTTVPGFGMSLQVWTWGFCGAWILAVIAMVPAITDSFRRAV